MIDEGLRAYARGEYFEAHDHFEAAWKSLRGPEREAARGLVQVAAAELKRTQGNDAGVEKLLTKAATTLLAAGATHGSVFGLDVTAIAGRITIARATKLGPIALPRATEPIGVLYLHGFASGPSSAKAQAFRAAAERLGASIRVPDLDEGDFSRLTVSRALARARRSLFERTIVVGSSMGGYIATLLGDDPRVSALVLMAPAYDLAARLELRYGPEALAEWRARGVREVDHHATGRKELLEVGFFDDARTHPPFPPIARPAYVLQGLRDDTVPPSLAEEARRRATAEVELDLVDDDHALVATVDRATAALERAWMQHR